MDQRIRFIHDLESNLFSVSELCHQYGISRKTGYKWLQRHEDDGVQGLADRPHTPDSCPHRIDSETASRILVLRRKHPSWGPRKLIAVLSEREPGLDWPAASTTGDLLRTNGLVVPRRRRPRRTQSGGATTPVVAPNQVWAADYKGQFRLGSSDYCYPLTITDQYSRYLLLCKGLPSTEHEGGRAGFERAFREFGLPDAIHTDNGTPFASTALRRLSRLSVWWIHLDIRPELSRPAHPQDNGRHERMHRTLKAETTRPPASNFWTQQIRFERFRADYNEIRPHEALGQKPPASLYKTSPRPYPRKLPPIDYPGHYEVRRVSRNGGIRWHSDWVNISHVLAEEFVGLEETDDGVWSVYFGSLLLGRFDLRDPLRRIIGGHVN